MTALAILRVAKLKSLNNVSGSEAHTARLQDTPSSDPTKTNIRLIGNPDDPTLKELIESTIAQKCKHKPRKDAVLCTEIFLSASPEYFRPDEPSRAGKWDNQLMLNFADASTQWLLKNYGDKCIRAELHLDESTPHIHAYLVPLNNKTKQLSHQAMFGGKTRLSKLQDNYAAAMAPLGIERGIKGSTATHTKVKEYYTAVNSNPLLLQLDRLAPQRGETAQQLFERIKADPQIQTINHQLADRERAIVAEKEAQSTTVRALKKSQALETDNLKLRKQVDQLRDLPLEDVAWQLGLTKTDGKWKGLEHIINIDGTKFHDFRPGSSKGGGGAIDLVMHVNNCNFNEALVWLRSRFKEEGMLRAVLSQAGSQAKAIVSEELLPKFQLPHKDSWQWLPLKSYLTQNRALPESQVTELYNSGLIYADSRQNAVFRMRDLDGQTNGAFLRGIKGENNTFKGYVPGTKRDEGWFYVRAGGQQTDKVQRVVLCKSPIDALSLATIEVELLALKPEMQREPTMYLVVDSALSLPKEFLKNIPKVVTAYDSDAAGDETAREIQELLPQAVRVRPHAKDWNLELLERRRLQLSLSKQQGKSSDKLELNG